MADPHHHYPLVPPGVGVVVAAAAVDTAHGGMANHTATSQQAAGTGSHPFGTHYSYGIQDFRNQYLINSDIPAAGSALGRIAAGLSADGTNSERMHLTIGLALAIASVIIFAAYVSRNKIRSVLPGFLRPFAQEEHDAAVKPKRWSFWTLILALDAFAGLALAVAPLALLSRRRHRHDYNRHLLDPAGEEELLTVMLDVVPWIAAALVTAVDRPVSTPRMLLLQYFLMVSADASLLSSHFLLGMTTSPPAGGGIVPLDPFRASRLGLAILAVMAIASMPLRHPSRDSRLIGSPSTPPSNTLRSPEDNLTLFQFWTMSWVRPLAAICPVREMVVEDVWQLPAEFQHAQLYLAYRDLRGGLVRRLARANGLDLAAAMALANADALAAVLAVTLGGRLYRSLDAGDHARAVFWALVVFCLDALRQVAKTSGAWFSRKAYERCRGEVFIDVFGKLLTRAVPGSDATEKGPETPDAEVDDDDDASRGRQLGQRRCRRWYHVFRSKCLRSNSNSIRNDSSSDSYRSLPSQEDVSQPAEAATVASAPASNAKVINLVRGDTYEISQRFWELPRLSALPPKIVFIICSLVGIMGPAAYLGIALLAAFVALNSLLVRRLLALERSRTAHSDKRAQAVAHFVEASRPLKLYGWTASWTARIMGFRALEMRKRLHMSYITALISTSNVLGGASYPLASICLFVVYYRGAGLPNEVIWPSLQLFAQLEASVKEAFDICSATFKAAIPVERVNKYMAEPDRDGGDRQSWGADAGHVAFKNASFAWPSTGRTVLDDVTLTLGPGLTVIRGKVGAGKSSLLLAALNEMELRGGALSRHDEPISYAQQLPWLQNKSIIENIIFDAQYEHNRYNQVIDICALAPDLARMQEGDGTRLEEGGIGLSGGQKARVALARALYARTAIVLLDDPLAALDHDTASSIVRKMCRGGETVDGRTIVMVTHRDDLVLRVADKVIDVDQGRARVLSREEVEEELKHPHHTPAGHDMTSDDDNEDAADENGAREGVGADEQGCSDAPETVTETGSIPFSVYAKYVKAGGLHLWILLATFYVASRWCDISRARLLEAWGHDTADDGGRGFWNLPDSQRHPSPWLCVLAALSGAQVLTHGTAQFLLAHICVNAAQGLFRQAVDMVGRATFRYHDATPTGQLKNRLIADMGMVDGGILAPLESFVYNLIVLSLSLAAMTTHKPVLLVVLAGVALAFVRCFRIYVPASRSLRRMEMRYLTPIISNIGVMQDGLVTIRALRVESRFQDRHLAAVDDFQKQDHFFWSMSHWLDVRLGLASALARLVLVLLMVWDRTAASIVGFVLTQTGTAMTSVQQLCDKYAQLQLDAVSLERVDQLNRIPEEHPGDEEPPADWPRPDDAVTFEGVCFRYDEGLPDVLRDMSFVIPGGSTCAVLGRTGSGKSTIANVLLATQELSSGSVRVGAVDISRVSRQALRSRITMIQQEPTLFPGSLRENMDPESRFSDEACLAAIRRVLGPGWSLDTRVDAGGRNFSQGQRQLVSIGRAVLRRSGLVIMDEATASVDRATAAVLQRILKEDLGGCTVVTIAHRLEAVEGADWCLRLEDGKVVECGPASGLGRREDVVTVEDGEDDEDD
ncbi:hypothetical protein N3K66_001694 [Trichothecium roseum]|uniref:Uncharacterized protein n=1 Tax=Trichothecium roseum TaxID=47278 RepID=A0ACC0V7G6_9HYPO|nr:hypothetical protein N3K66_001694 [Trichothecium roseum]